MSIDEVITLLQQKSIPAYLKGMKRFAIENTRALGIPIPEVRKLARVIKKDHALALELWKTGLHEARILASLVDDPAFVTRKQINEWVKDFNSWDICDQVCGNLFDRTPFAIEMAIAFSGHNEEFVKRTGFVLMAEYAVHSKTADNKTFVNFMQIIEHEAWDGRNFVKKGSKLGAQANWQRKPIPKNCCH